MTVKQMTPYLFFGGNADEALRLYERTLGATVEELVRYEKMPRDAGTCPPEDANRVMHARARVGEAAFMVSDVPSGRPAPPGGKVQILLEFDDTQDMARRFDALAASGKVIMALHDAFWGARFGIVEDGHGIHWMFSCATEGR